MFPHTPWARPVGSFQIPVPPPTPVGGLCSELTITFPAEWKPYIVGALQQLILQATWQGTRDEVINAQQRAAAIIGTIQQAKCEVPPESGGIGCGDFDMASCGCFRQQGDELQMFCCGEWTTIFKVGTGTPTAGQPQPAAGGGSQSVCLDLIANQSVPLGVNVSSGDTLLLSNLNGTWRDITSLLGIINCPDGYIYAEGACFANFPSGSPDPVPTALHMGIIAYIDGTAYDVTGITAFIKDPVLFTVPPGITNKPVFFQANIDNLQNAAGNVSFCVEVTNNAAATWSHDLDFTISPMGFAPISLSSGPLGQWTPGSGFEQTNANDAPSTDYYTGFQVERSFGTPVHFTDIRANFDLTLGSPQGAADVYGQFILVNSSETAGTAPGSQVNGNGQTMNNNSDNPGVTTLGIAVIASKRQDASYGGGSCRGYFLHVEGTGYDPFV